MISLYDELAEKLRRDPSRLKRGGPRFDLSLLLFNFREAVRDLWAAAEAELEAARADGREPPEALAAAVSKLRPLFGERSDSQSTK